MIAEASPVVISRHTAKGVFLYVSSACRQLTGYEPEELVGHPISVFIQIADNNAIRQAARSALAQTEPQKATYQIRRKDGSYIWVETTFKPVPDASGGEFLAFTRDASDSKHIENVLQMLARETLSGSGEDFFRPLVSQLARALRANYAFVTETNPEQTRVRMLAFWKGDNFGSPFEYPLGDTPCDKVINQGKVCYYPLGVQNMFPKDKDLVDLNAQSYVGVPISGSAGRVIGHLAVLHDKPMKLQDYELSILKIFARYAAAELETYRQNHRES